MEVPTHRGRDIGHDGVKKEKGEKKYVKKKNAKSFSTTA